MGPSVWGWVVLAVLLAGLGAGLVALIWLWVDRGAWLRGMAASLVGDLERLSNQPETPPRAAEAGEWDRIEAKMRAWEVAEFQRKMAAKMEELRRKELRARMLGDRRSSRWKRARLRKVEVGGRRRTMRI